ncbi:MAG TPA: prolipoprotein diacylglyceryl transferase [Patescibacteria group bacterium]|nr:prolipoprotein diacylglyceryl transferase [Patescibacteria group bacterium]
MTTEQKQLIKVVLTALGCGLGFFVVFIYLLQPFFRGAIVLPQHVGLGGINLQFYGVIIGLAALSAYWLSSKRRSMYEVSAEDADSIYFFVLIFGFIGARIYHVVSEFGYYVHYPWQSFAVWNGGLSIFGAGLGGVLALVVYKKIYNHYSLWQLLDWLTPGVVLGQIIGRFGNFVNYELYGSPTNLPWKMFVPPQFRIPTLETFQFFHPLFLYEAAGSVVILVLLLRLKLRSGRLFLLWLLLYNVMRLFLENLRANSVIYAGIRVNAVVALVLALIAISIYVHPNFKPNTPNS